MGSRTDYLEDESSDESSSVTVFKEENSCVRKFASFFYTVPYAIGLGFTLFGMMLDSWADTKRPQRAVEYRGLWGEGEFTKGTCEAGAFLCILAILFEMIAAAAYDKLTEHRKTAWMHATSASAGIYSGTLIFVGCMCFYINLWHAQRLKNLSYAFGITLAGGVIIWLVGTTHLIKIWWRKVLVSLAAAAAARSLAPPKRHHHR